MFLLAATNLLGLLSSVFIGTSIGVMLWWVLSALRSDDLEQGDEWRYDVSRINELRRAEPIYRIFQPVIKVFAKLNRAALPGSLGEIRRESYAAGKSLGW